MTRLPRSISCDGGGRGGGNRSGSSINQGNLKAGEVRGPCNCENKRLDK